MVAGLDAEPEKMTEWNTEHVALEDMSRFVLDSSKGLAELTKSMTPTVQFIHESVRDFLIKDDGLSKLWPELTGDLNTLSHDQLKMCCQNYLAVDLSSYVSSDQVTPKASSYTAINPRSELAIKSPFLEYASQYILYHADEAARGIPKENFLQAFALETWLNVTNLLERFEIRRHASNAGLVYVLAENNFPRLFRTISRNASALNVREERYQYPLFAALANGHRDAVRALLQQGNNTSTEDITMVLELAELSRLEKTTRPFFGRLRRGTKWSLKSL